MVSSSKIQPVILSGGSGTRLWPMSTPGRPKQFLKLTGDQTMLQLTALRASDESSYAPPIIIANAAHRQQIEDQLSKVGIEGARLILEPVGRNTAPAIALAALSVAPETPLLVMPSDHVIRDIEGFLAAVEEASTTAEQGFLVTFGIKPEQPETGFGYIKGGEPLQGRLAKVACFVEKPNAETASRYLEEGGYYWNAGIFLFRAGDFLDALETHAPEILATCREAVSKGNAGAITEPDQSSFSRCPSISIDYAVMEKAERVAVCPVEIGWSDIGSWDALYEYLQEEGAGAVNGERSLQISSEGCFVKSEGPLVATVGVKDLIIIATEDAVLVMSRGESQRAKEVAEQLNKGCMTGLAK